MELITLPAHNPGPYTGPRGNNTYLLAGAEPTLIDAGVGHAEHLRALEAALAGAPLARVIVTHAHSDHASGAAAVAARWPAAEFVKYPWPDRDARYGSAWRAVADEERVRAGDTTLRVVHTPGHAPDHICLWHEDTRTMFCGDLAARGTTVVIPGARGGDLVQYIASLERVLALAPAVMLPAHGPALHDAERILRGYIEHRRQRESEILEILSEGPATIDDIVAELYPTLRQELIGAAADSVLAHLMKLEKESRVVRDEDRWRPCV